MRKKSKEIIFAQFRVVVNLFSGEVCDRERAQKGTSEGGDDILFLD